MCKQNTIAALYTQVEKIVRRSLFLFIYCSYIYIPTLGANVVNSNGTSNRNAAAAPLFTEKIKVYFSHRGGGGGVP